VKDIAEAAARGIRPSGDRRSGPPCFANDSIHGEYIDDLLWHGDMLLTRWAEALWCGALYMFGACCCYGLWRSGQVLWHGDMLLIWWAGVWSCALHVLAAAVALLLHEPGQRTCSTGGSCGPAHL
jgi:hypothetical protein